MKKKQNTKEEIIFKKIMVVQEKFDKKFGAFGFSVSTDRDLLYGRMVSSGAIKNFISEEIFQLLCINNEKENN